MAMDVDVEVGQDKLSFRGFGLSANLRGAVHIGDNLDTRGELSLVDGRYRAYGQRLTIRRARLLLAGPIDQPYLDIEAVRKTDDVIAGIRLSGSAEQPTTQVFSEPAMSQEQALSYLVLGRPLGSTGEDNNMLAQAALGLGLAGSSDLTGSLAKSLGIDDFQLDTQGSGASTSVVASGNLTERLSLRYGVGVFEPANTIALRYLLSKSSTWKPPVGSPVRLICFTNATSESANGCSGDELVVRRWRCRIGLAAGGNQLGVLFDQTIQCLGRFAGLKLHTNLYFVRVTMIALALVLSAYGDHEPLVLECAVFQYMACIGQFGVLDLYREVDLHPLQGQAAW